MTQSKVKSKGEHALIYVLAGKDEPLVNARRQELIDELIEPSQRVTGLFDADPNSVSILDVLDELRTLPFLTDRRVVLISRADKFISENRELLEKYFDEPCATGILVLTVESWAGNTRLAKKLVKVGRLIKVDSLKGRPLIDRVIAYALDAHDKRLARDAAGLLVELTGDELTRLYSEVDKLALYAEGARAITVEHIEGLIGHNRIFGAFDVIDAIVAGQAGRAVERLRRMFAEDKSAEYTVVGAFAYHLRRMFNAKVLIEKGARPKAVAEKLRIWGNTDRFFAQLRQMSLRQVGEYLASMGEADYAIKTGREKAPVAMEQLVLRLAGC